MLNLIGVMILVFTINGEWRSMGLETISPQACISEIHVLRDLVTQMGGNVVTSYCILEYRSK